MINAAGFRHDGRTVDETREIQCSMNTIHMADGSASYSIGATSVHAAVYGPRECQRKRDQEHDRATINVKLESAAFSRGERLNPNRKFRRDRFVQELLQDTFTTAIHIHLFPRSQIDIFVQVVQNDGGVEAAAINAATLALVDAGIPLNEYVVACTSGFLDD